MSEPKIIYGYYSQRQADACGTWDYRRPDGSVVTVSMVDNSPDYKSGWDDMRCVGEVVEFAVVRWNNRLEALLTTAAPA